MSDRPSGPSPGGASLRTDRRGQTLLDYSIGVGLFLVALVFVLGTVPGMFAPFTTGADAQIGDRVADTLAADQLGDPETPYVLNATCTGAFFEQMNDDGFDTPETCRFDTTVDDLEPLFGLDGTTSLNVSVTTLEGAETALHVDGADRTLVAGDPVPATASVTTARRTVHLDGRTCRLEVTVW